MKHLRSKIREIHEKIRLYQNVGRFDSAEKLAKSSLKDFGPLANVIHLLGITYHKQSRFPEAIFQFKSAIHINSEFIESSLCLAVTLCDLGQYEEGLEIFEKTIKQKLSEKRIPSLILGRLANLHAKTGKAYEEIGLFAEAISEYNRSLILLPRMSDVRLALAKLYIKTDQLAKATKELREILNLTDTISETRTLLGMILYKSGQKNEAQNQWIKALQMNPDDLTARIYSRMHETKTS
ncbi:MAG: tetratricopeptide repeat protein [Oligoflexales bacterium]|nr:tetratricopeptide repeat protein [Oligoflexales bacterium]